MALKYIITDEADLPKEEQLKGLYQKDGEQWVLQVEGAVPKKQHDEFRESNVELRKKLEAFGDTDPKAAAAAVKRVEELEAELGNDKAKLDALLEKRVGEMKAEHEKQVEELKGSLAKANGELDTLTIDQQLIEAGQKLGLREGASADLVSRGRQIFKRDEDGNVIAYDADGQKKYGPGGDVLTPEAYVKSLTKEAEHLFDPSKGSGSGGSGSGAGGQFTGKNPWKKDSFNLTQQARMVRENPQLAQQMAAAAGKAIDTSAS